MADMDYIPATDDGFRTWAETFAQNIQLDPNVYQFTAADATTISDAVDEFVAALAVADNPMTRTTSNITIKDTKRNAAEALCRQYAVQIKYNNGITDDAKIDIGVRPVNSSREPIYCPQSSPLINVTGNTPGAQTVRYADSLAPESRGKPFGAAALQLFVYIGDAATVNEDDASFLGLYTKNPVVVAFDPADDGKMATYFARWSGKRGDVGNWSLPVSMRIAA